MKIIESFSCCSKNRVFALLLAVPLIALLFLKGNAWAGLIESVSVSAVSFNPALKQTVTLSFNVTEPATVSVGVIDRNGYVVRTLAVNKKVEAGKESFVWNSLDDSGVMVPDEAWSWKIDASSKNHTESYFPANGPVERVGFPVEYYSRQNAVIRYTLPKPARVRVEATIGKYVGGKLRGGVARTIVNGEPRIQGQIVETWTGYDSSGTINITDLPEFGIHVTAEYLPENSVTTTGNSATRFLDFLSKRSGKSLFSPGTEKDPSWIPSQALFAPVLNLKVADAVWSDNDQSWKTEKHNELHLTGSLEGPTAGAFATESGKIKVFVDGVESDYPLPGGLDADLRIPLPEGASKGQIVVINWINSYGITAAQCFRIKSNLPNAVAK